MRIDSEYRDFLESEGPLNYLLRRLEEIRGMRDKPLIADLLAAAARREAGGDLDGVDDEIRAFLAKDSAFVLTELRRWVHEAAVDDKVLPPFREVVEYDEGLFHNVSLTRRDCISITVSSVSQRELEKTLANGTKSRVLFSGQKVFFKFLKADAVRLVIWECDPFDDSSEFRNLTCRRSSEVVVSSGDCLEIDGCRQSLSFAQCDQTVVFLQVENLAKDVRTSVAFEESTGRFMATYPTDRTALRRMVMCSALKHMGTHRRLAGLPATARDGPFYLRWHFAREMVAASPDDTRPLLEVMVKNDPSPTIRRAARSTLDLIQTRGGTHVA